MTDLENELNLKNAELQLEIARSKETESILLEANQLLNLVAEISKDIVEEGNKLNIYEILKKIGNRLDLNKIFLLRFSDSIDSYMEWVKDEFHKSTKCEILECDVLQLMNWVYKREFYSGTINDLPEFLKMIDCQNSKSALCSCCNLIIIPLIAENKPWGLIGYVKNTQIDACDLTKKSLHNLSNMLAILIKRDEEMQSLSRLIDAKIIEFNKILKQIKDQG